MKKISLETAKSRLTIYLELVREGGPVSDVQRWKSQIKIYQRLIKQLGGNND